MGQRRAAKVGDQSGHDGIKCDPLDFQRSPHHLEQTRSMAHRDVRLGSKGSEVAAGRSSQTRQQTHRLDRRTRSRDSAFTSQVGCGVFNLGTQSAATAAGELGQTWRRHHRLGDHKRSAAGVQSGLEYWQGPGRRNLARHQRSRLLVRRQDGEIRHRPHPKCDQENPAHQIAIKSHARNRRLHCSRFDTRHRGKFSRHHICDDESFQRDRRRLQRHHAKSRRSDAERHQRSKE